MVGHVPIDIEQDDYCDFFSVEICGLAILSEVLIGVAGYGVCTCS